VNKDQQEQLEREQAFAAVGMQVVNNEAFKQAMTARKAQIFDTFCRSSADQTELRDEAWRTMKNMKALEDFLNTALQTGKMADATLEQMRPAETH
jgi:hypothetical protein